MPFLHIVYANHNNVHHCHRGQRQTSNAVCNPVSRFQQGRMQHSAAHTKGDSPGMYGLLLAGSGLHFGIAEHDNIP